MLVTCIGSLHFITVFADLAVIDPGDEGCAEREMHRQVKGPPKLFEKHLDRFERYGSFQVLELI